MLALAAEVPGYVGPVGIVAGWSVGGDDGREVRCYRDAGVVEDALMKGWVVAVDRCDGKRKLTLPVGES